MLSDALAAILVALCFVSAVGTGVLAVRFILMVRKSRDSSGVTRRRPDEGFSGGKLDRPLSEVPIPRAPSGVSWPRPGEGIRGKGNVDLSKVRFPTAPSGVVRVREVSPHDGESAIYEAARSMSGEAWERFRERMDACDRDLDEGPDPLFAKKTPLDGERGEDG